MMNSNEQAEYELAVRARNGDFDALSELVERLRLRLFTAAYGELRHFEDAQDAVASSLVRICTHICDLREAASFRAWVYAIVRNETRRIRRQRIAAASHVSLQDVPDLTSPPELSILRLDVEQALRRLPADQSHALALFYLANHSIRDIARRTNRPEGTIKSWLHHGRQQLALSMKEYALMTPTETPIEWTAAIVSDSMEPVRLNSLSDALRAAGFSRVNVFRDCNEIIGRASFRLWKSPDNPEWPTSITSRDNDITLCYPPEPDSPEEPPIVVRKQLATMLHLPDALKGTHYLILDQHIGKRSAFELHTILRAAEKEDDILMMHCILLDNHWTKEQANDITSVAVWLSGFNVSLFKNVTPEEFEVSARQVRKNMAHLLGKDYS